MCNANNDHNQDRFDAANDLGKQIRFEEFTKTMTKKFMLAFAAAMMAISAAEKHNITLFQPSLVNGTELAPGDYRMELDGDKMTLSKGKQKVEASVKTEQADAKFGSTSVRYSNADGKYKIQEIRLGGTNRKLVLGGSQSGL